MPPPPQVRLEREVVLLLYGGRFVLIENLSAVLGTQGQSSQWRGTIRQRTPHNNKTGQELAYEHAVPCARCCRGLQQGRFGGSPADLRPQGGDCEQLEGSPSFPSPLGLHGSGAIEVCQTFTN